MRTLYERKENEGIWFLMGYFRDLSASMRDSLTYSIRSGSLFGDGLYHDLTVYWEEQEHKYRFTSGEQYPICLEATLDGHESSAVIKK